MLIASLGNGTKVPPRVMGAGYLSAAEVVATAEIGVADATVSPSILRDLFAKASSSPPFDTPRQLDAYADANVTFPPRLAHLLKVDLHNPEWSGEYYGGRGEDLDWLADCGKRLDEAIEADEPAKTRLAFALEFFVQQENKSREIIEALIKGL